MIAGFTGVFGIGMLFYGIELMKTGAEPLKQLPWFSELLNSSHNSLVLSFALSRPLLTKQR